MKYLLLIFLYCSLLACGKGSWQSDQSQSSKQTFRSQAFSLEERNKLFPNPLFLAVVDNEPLPVLREILLENGEYLLSTNSEGDTPLGVAINFHNPEAARFIADQMTAEHYMHTNKAQESYLYLASRKGYVKLIQLLSIKFYHSVQPSIFTNYEFSDLDLKTKQGERALHVAKNYATAETLKNEYWRGGLEYPFRQFQYLKNSQDQVFLHTAVRDRNSDLLRWGVTENCGAKEEWNHQPWYYKVPATGWRTVQKYGRWASVNWDDLINSRDNQGLTPLNFAAKNLFTEGIRILASCQWQDYLLADNEENIPLQNFLLNLDPLKTHHDPTLKKAFTLLLEGQTRLTFSGIGRHVNHINKIGDSSLHIAARLADPFFYEQLQRYGDVEQKNHEKLSPRLIFESKQKQLNKILSSQETNPEMIQGI